MIIEIVLHIKCLKLLGIYIDASERIVFSFYIYINNHSCLSLLFDGFFFLFRHAKATKNEFLVRITKNTITYFEYSINLYEGV